jgi:hypothetical protein
MSCLFGTWSDIANKKSTLLLPLKTIHAGTLWVVGLDPVRRLTFQHMISSLLLLRSPCTQEEMRM